MGDGIASLVNLQRSKLSRPDLFAALNDDVLGLVLAHMFRDPSLLAKAQLSVSRLFTTIMSQTTCAVRVHDFFVQCDQRAAGKIFTEFLRAIDDGRAAFVRQVDFNKVDTELLAALVVCMHRDYGLCVAVELVPGDDGAVQLPEPPVRPGAEQVFFGYSLRVPISDGVPQDVADTVWKRLLMLHIAGGGVSGPLRFKKLPAALRRLVISDCTIDKTSTESLLACLIHSQRVAELSLSSNKIDDGAVAALADALKVNAVVKKLDLSNNDISLAGASALAEALRVNAVLKNLNLRRNKIGDAGAAALADALKVNAVLTERNLACNSIEADGAAALADALKFNAVLTDLNSLYNRIGDAGAAAIAEALRVNAVMKNLILARNNIGDAGAAALADALKVNAVLTDLNLNLNDIDDEGAKALAEALKVNAALEYLYLQCNEIGAEAKAKLRAAAKPTLLLPALMAGLIDARLPAAVAVAQLAVEGKALLQPLVPLRAVRRERVNARRARIEASKCRLCLGHPRRLAPPRWPSPGFFPRHCQPARGGDPLTRAVPAKGVGLYLIKCDRFARLQIAGPARSESRATARACSQRRRPPPCSRLATASYTSRRTTSAPPRGASSGPSSRRLSSRTRSP